MNKGKMSESALKRSVLKKTGIYNKRSGAGIGADAGYIRRANGDLMISTACIMGEDRGNGELCLTRAVNSMACAGGKALAASVSLICPAKDPESFARLIMDEVIRACDRCGIEPVSGNTLIGDTASISVSVTGEAGNAITPPDQDKDRIIVMDGWAGNAGAAMLAVKNYSRLTERFTEGFIRKAISGFNEIGIYDRAYAFAEATGGRIAMHDISEGGVFGALWELLERENAGCRVDLKAIPIKQAAIEVCEILDVSPYQLRGDGGLLAMVEDTPENRTLGTVIGAVTSDRDRVIINGEERRFLEPNRYDGYYEA